MKVKNMLKGIINKNLFILKNSVENESVTTKKIIANSVNRKTKECLKIKYKK